MGDGFLAEFASGIDALNCAVAIQRSIGVRNDPLSDGDDVFGDGVNIAARLEPLAESGGIVISDALRVQLTNKVDVGFEPLGPQQLKNITDTMDVYRIVKKQADVQITKRANETASQHDATPVLAILPFGNQSNDPDQDHLGDGITEDLISSLSQIEHLSVTARNSAFTF